MATSTRSPTVNADDVTVGTVAWSYASGDVFSDDDNDVTATIGSSNVSYYLKATDFDFDLEIDAGATIDGVEVGIRKWAANGGGSATLTDYSVVLVNGGTPTGTDKADATSWPSSESASSYGGAADLWGLSLTAADVRSSGFGVAISVQGTGGMAPNTAHVDSIQITIHYTLPADEGPPQRFIATRALRVRPRRPIVFMDDWADDPAAPEHVDHPGDVVSRVAPRKRPGRSSVASPLTRDSGLSDADAWPPQIVIGARSRRPRGGWMRPFVFDAGVFDNGDGTCSCPPGGAVVLGQNFGVVVVSMSSDVDQQPATLKAEVVSVSGGKAVVVSVCDC